MAQLYRPIISILLTLFAWSNLALAGDNTFTEPIKPVPLVTGKYQPCPKIRYYHTSILETNRLNLTNKLRTFCMN